MYSVIFWSGVLAVQVHRDATPGEVLHARDDASVGIGNGRESSEDQRQRDADCFHSAHFTLLAARVYEAFGLATRQRCAIRWIDVTIPHLFPRAGLGSFGWFVVLVYFPARWRRFIDWENALSIRLGVPHSVARWLKKHETGATLKIVVIVLTLTSALCAIKAAHLLK
ncbi:MAG: hypothetical protein WDO13_18315 [Verrucomicrobiota bacterium]